MKSVNSLVQKRQMLWLVLSYTSHVYRTVSQTPCC